MGFLLSLVFVSAAGASASDCVLQAQKNLPYIFLVGVGQPIDWKPDSTEVFTSVNEEIRQIRARIFKEARTKNLPLLSQTYISLNGRDMGPYLEPVKSKHDKNNRIYGIESEWALALKSNFELMSHYYANAKKKHPYVRLQHLYFLTIKFPSIRVIWDEMYTKAETYKIYDIRMGIRRFNNAVIEFEAKQGSQALVGKTSAPYRVRNYFKQRIRKPLAKNKNADEIAEKMLETFHQRLVEHVNKTLKQDFRFYGPRDQKKERLPEILTGVRKLQIMEVGSHIRKMLCHVVDRPAVVVWVHLPLLEAIKNRILGFDKRLKLEAFDTFKSEDRKKIIETLSQRWSKHF